MSVSAGMSHNLFSSPLIYSSTFFKRLLYEEYITAETHKISLGNDVSNAQHPDNINNPFTSERVRGRIKADERSDSCPFGLLILRVCGKVALQDGWCFNTRKA